MIKIVEAHGQLIHVYARGGHDEDQMPLKSRRVWDLATYVSMNEYETYVEHD